MLVDFGGSVPLGLPGTQLDESLLHFLQDLNLREQLMVNLRYCLPLAFCGVTVNGDQFCSQSVWAHCPPSHRRRLTTIYTHCPQESAGS